MYISTVIFLAATATVYFVGGLPEREGAIIVLVWSVLDVVRREWLGSSAFVTVDIFRFLIDLAMLIAIVRLSLRANRIWPILAAASQLVCILGHISPLILQGGMQRAYWAMTQLPQLVILGSLISGTFFHSKRVGSFGPYRAWSA